METDVMSLVDAEMSRLRSEIRVLIRERDAARAEIKDLKRQEAALRLIARGVWTAPNSVEAMVWIARQALKRTPATED